MIVVDTNIIAYFWIPGDWTPLTEKVMQKDSEWIAPLLWRSEFRNILLGYIRKDQITRDAAQKIMAHAELLFNGNEYPPASSEVLRLAASSTCSAYDCEFVALAKALSLPLLTMDKTILKNFPETAVSLTDFTQ